MPTLTIFSRVGLCDAEGEGYVGGIAPEFVAEIDLTAAHPVLSGINLSIWLR